MIKKVIILYVYSAVSKIIEPLIFHLQIDDKLLRASHLFEFMWFNTNQAYDGIYFVHSII